MREPTRGKEARARALEDAGGLFKTVLDFLESDAAHLETMGVREGVPEFPWDARDRAVTEMVFAIEGLRSRIRHIENAA